MWMVMKLYRWSSLKIEHPFINADIDDKEDSGSIGFSIIYEDKEKALKYCDDESQLMEIDILERKA